MKKRCLAAVLAVFVLMLSVSATAEIGDETAQTPLYGSSSSKLHNLELAVEQLDGTVLYYGDVFSFNETVGPRTREEGYRSAVNGRGAKVYGGGVSQLATTLYLAARDSIYVTIDPFETYDERFAEWYVEDGSEAIITDYAAGTDFSFTSWFEGAIYISAWMDEEYVYCSLEFDENGERAGMISRASTPIFGSDNKHHNISLAAGYIDGFTMNYGDEFSFNEIVGPRVREAGFLSAVNGRGVKVTGGGVAQVASTVYLAVKELDCIQIDPIKTYGDRFSDGYVSDPDDAIVTDYNAGTDFSFTYWGEYELSVWIYEDEERLVCEIYEN